MPFSKCKDAVKSFLVNRLREKIKMSLPGDGCDRSLYVFGPMRATCDRHSLFACCSIFVKQNVLKTSEALSASTLSRHISKNAGGKTSPLSPVAFWRTLIQHWGGDSYCNYYCHMHRFALQIRWHRTSSECLWRPGVKMTLPSILFWISFFTLQGWFTLVSRGLKTIIQGTLCDLKEQLKAKECRLLTEPG